MGLLLEINSTSNRPKEQGTGRGDAEITEPWCFLCRHGSIDFCVLSPRRQGQQERHTLRKEMYLAETRLRGP